MMFLCRLYLSAFAYQTQLSSNYITRKEFCCDIEREVFPFNLLQIKYCISFTFDIRLNMMQL